MLRFACFVLVAVLLTTLRTESVDAQNDTIEKVTFPTADGVKLSGTFYRGPKAAPTVLMMHNIGDNSNKQAWIDLAKTLQGTFSVLTFDFRGHGDSTEIDPMLYFKYPANKSATAGASATKVKLDWKEINKGAYQLFVNDIAAAKSYLERTKNDLGQCNSQNMVLVGAEQGATLAAIWANSEFYRYKMDIQPLFAPRFETASQGKYLNGIVFLTPSPKLGTREVGLARILDVPSRINAVPSVFVYSAEDSKSRELSKSLEKHIKLFSKKVDKRLPFTGSVPVKGAGKLTGVDLLKVSLGAGKDQKDQYLKDHLHAFLKEVVEKFPNEWNPRDFLKTQYVWRMAPNLTPTPARTITSANPPFPSLLFPPNLPIPDAVEKNINFDTYERWIHR